MAAIEKEFGIVPEIKSGPRGAFNVNVDRSTVYSNLNEGGCLPDDEEIIERLREYHEDCAVGRLGHNSPEVAETARGGT